MLLLFPGSGNPHHKGCNSLQVVSLLQELFLDNNSSLCSSSWQKQPKILDAALVYNLGGCT